MFFSSIEDGGANCLSCHSGDFFTDEQYHVLASPQIGRGKGNDNGTLTNDDFGRARETKDDADRYKFRTPTLLNVETWCATC
jgi:cytochrome c peroxidase